ncbi:MAG: 50S ribosomal protein L29 [Armatimonadetes bacterium]|nr:50S ribosomal protein L29 [Armatimonadota bacterium]
MPHEIRTLKQFLREANADELERRLSELRQEHFQLRVQAVTAALENPKRIWMVRKQIARVLTEQHRRRREGAEQ